MGPEPAAIPPDDIGPVIAGRLSEDNRRVKARRIEESGGQDI